MAAAVELCCCFLLLFSGTTGIVLDKSAVLLSTDPQANCNQYSTVVCEPEVTQTLYNLYDTYEYNTYANSGSNEYCPNGNCLSQIPSPLMYQLIHSKKEHWKIVVRLKWDLIIQDNCQVHKYYVLLKSSVNSDSSKISNCSKFLEGPSPFLFTVKNTSNEINIKSNFPEWNHYYIKVIAYPIYEWPTLYIQVPTSCSNFPTCRNCGCTPVTKPPSGVSVSAIGTTYNTISANISWLPLSSTTEYFLYINSTISGKKLYRLGKVSKVVIKDIPTDEETYFWLEQFSCGCSNSTPVYSLSDALNVSSGNPPSPNDIISPSSGYYNTHSSSPSLSSSFLSTSTIITSPTNYPSSGYSSTHSSSPSLSSSFPTTSIITPPTNYPSSGYSSTHSSSPSLSSSFLTTSTITSPTNYTLKKPTISPLTYIPAVVILLVIIILITIIVVILIARRRKKPVYPNLDGSNSAIKSPYLQPQVTCPSLTLSQPVKSQAKVISIIAHNTAQSDKEPYLAYLDDLRDYGIQVLTYDRAERITPAEWLCKSLECTPKPVVLVVINKHFYQEWNANHKAEIPLVFALQQLILSLLQQSQDLQNFALILPTLSDKQYIPNGYLHTAQQFALQDTQGISRFILNVREYTVDCSY